MKRKTPTGTRLILSSISFIALVGYCSADDSRISESIWVIPAAITLMAFLAIIYVYKLTSTEGGLEQRIKKDQEIIKKQVVEIRMNQDRIVKQRRIEKQEETEVSSEIEGITKRKGGKRGSRGIRGDFWDKLGRVGSGKENEGDRKTLEELNDEREKIREMIKLAQKKYHQKEIGEDGFKSMINEYQRRLIEIEARINEISRECEGDEVSQIK